MSILQSNAASLPAWQQRALAHLFKSGPQPYSKAVYSERHNDPESFIYTASAIALARQGLIDVSEVVSLTPRGRRYAGALAGRAMR